MLPISSSPLKFIRRVRAFGNIYDYCRIILLIMKTKLLTILIASNLGCAPAFASPDFWADDDKFSLSTGFDHRSGKYDTAGTSGMLSIPATGEYENGHWMIRVKAPNALVPVTSGAASGMRLVSTGITPDIQSALDDAVAAATYNLFSGSSSKTGIDLTGKVRLNSAVTGTSAQNDYAAQADAYQSYHKFTALGSLGYRFSGKPTGINIDKVLYGSFGGAYQLDEKLHGGVDLNLSQNSALTGEGQREISAYVSRKINKNFKAKGYVLRNFSNGSPDRSLGAKVYYGF